jgi:hypothetical protein
VYDELPGKEHWWWDSHTANDGGVTNDPAMRAMFERARRQSQSLEGLEEEEEEGYGEESKSEIEEGEERGAEEGGEEEEGGGSSAADVTASEIGLLPTDQTGAGGRRFEIVCHNPATFGGRAGVRPLQLEVPGHRGTVIFRPRNGAGGGSSSDGTSLLSNASSSSSSKSSKSSLSNLSSNLSSTSPCWALETENVVRLRVSRWSPLAAPHCTAADSSAAPPPSSYSSTASTFFSLSVDGQRVDLSAWLGPPVGNANRSRSVEATAAGEALDRFWEAGEEEQSSVRRAQPVGPGHSVRHPPCHRCCRRLQDPPVQLSRLQQQQQQQQHL